jgi:hypothetical protein
VRENSDLRPNQWELERRADGIVTRKRPPVRADCSYLITVRAITGKSPDLITESPHL